MQLAAVRISFVLGALCCGAQAQPAPQTEDGARPGNVIGTGMSLPRSNTASNLNAATARSELAPNLPAPPGPQDVRSLLLDARAALAAGRTGEAQEALERAETRALDRSVDLGTQNIPANGPLISSINRSRAALASGNVGSAITAINAALTAGE